MEEGALRRRWRRILDKQPEDEKKEIVDGEEGVAIGDCSVH